MGTFQTWVKGLTAGAAEEHASEATFGVISQLRSRDGFERERAVRDMQRCADPRALPLLLERANDWVPQVRSAAKGALVSFLCDEHIEHWRQALPAVEALRRGGREDHSSLLDSVHRFLMRTENLARLMEDWESLPRVARRMVFGLRLKPLLGQGELMRVLVEGVASADLVIASQALAMVNRLTQPTTRLSVFGTACGNPHASVRLAAMRLVAADPGEAARSLLRVMCWDSNAAVRALALELNSDQRAVVIDEALRRLKPESAMPGNQGSALHVLCALRHPDALAWCEHLVDSHFAPLRRAAFAGLFRLAACRTWGASAADRPQRSIFHRLLGP